MALELRRALARGLLRASKQLAAEPKAMALLFCRPRRVYDRNAVLALGEPKKSATQRALWSVGREFLWGAGPLRRVVAENLRRVRFRGGKKDDDVDDGLEALRFAHDVLALADQCPNSENNIDTGDDSLRPCAEDAPLAENDLLVAHPFSNASQPAFHRAVVQLTDVRPDGVIGRVVGDKLWSPTWDPRQLRVELERGVWARLRAPSPKHLAALVENVDRRALWQTAVAKACPDKKTGAALAALSMDADTAVAVLGSHLARHYASLLDAIADARRLHDAVSSSSPGGSFPPPASPPPRRRTQPRQQSHTRHRHPSSQ